MSPMAAPVIAMRAYHSIDFFQPTLTFPFFRNEQVAYDQMVQACT